MNQISSIRIGMLYSVELHAGRSQAHDLLVINPMPNPLLPLSNATVHKLESTAVWRQLTLC